MNARRALFKRPAGADVPGPPAKTVKTEVGDESACEETAEGAIELKPKEPANSVDVKASQQARDAAKLELYKKIIMKRPQSGQMNPDVK